MSLTSNIIVRLAYSRVGAFQGNASQIATDYASDAALADANTESFPLQSMYDILVGVENEMATAVAMNVNNTLRNVLGDIVTVTSGGLIPAISDEDLPIIGEWGQVRTAAGIELTPAMHEDEIRAIVNGPSGLFKTNYYSYALRPPRIYATQTTLEIDVCVFDIDARQTAINANEDLLFQQMQNAYFSGLMANLKNEDPAYTSLSNEYAPAYQAWLLAQNPPRDVVGQAAA